MKTLTVKNYGDGSGETSGSDGNRFTVREIIPANETSQCHANFVEVAPGNYAYSYHYHESEEEVFYIIKGTAAVRTANGEISLQEGDAVTFPCGPEGAHVIRNASSDQNLVYLDFGTAHRPEIVHLPDLKKVMVSGHTDQWICDRK